VFSGLLSHFPGLRHHAGRVRFVLAAAGCGALLALSASGCGTAAAPAASAAASPSASPGATAYLACLRQHGIAIPTARPTVRPTARPSGGFGANPAFQKAMQACASLRPKGAFGGFGGRFATAFKAFRSCMAAHGETIPSTRPTATPTATPSPGASPGADRFLNGLNPADPQVAAALKACESKLPAFAKPAS
jgi:hypothetical protein